MRAMRLLLPLALACLTLSSCKSSSVRAYEPPPPRIDCNERAPAERLAPIPKTWYGEWDTWAANAIAAYEAEVTKRAATADCMDRYRAEGLIR